MDPNVRIGDAERDAAVEALREHHVAGRLSPEEFSERMEAALSAHTRADLDVLFQDLPQDSPPAAQLAVPAAPAGLARPTDGYHRAIQVISAVAWPAALIFNFATGWQWWWVILIPALILPALVRNDPQARRHRLPDGRRDRRRYHSDDEGDDAGGFRP